MSDNQNASKEAPKTIPVGESKPAPQQNQGDVKPGSGKPEKQK